MSRAYVPYNRGVYLLHFQQPHYHARHYLGWARDIDARLDHHWSCKGCTWCSNFILAMRDAGIVWELARVWVGVPREYESYLKRRKDSPYLCPICTPNGKLGVDPYILVPQYYRPAEPCPF